MTTHPPMQETRFPADPDVTARALPSAKVTAVRALNLITHLMGRLDERPAAAKPFSLAAAINGPADPDYGVVGDRADELIEDLKIVAGWVESPTWHLPGEQLGYTPDSEPIVDECATEADVPKLPSDVIEMAPEHVMSIVEQHPDAMVAWSRLLPLAVDVREKFAAWKRARDEREVLRQIELDLMAARDEAMAEYHKAVGTLAGTDSV